MMKVVICKGEKLKLPVCHCGHLYCLPSSQAVMPYSSDSLSAALLQGIHPMTLARSIPPNHQAHSI